MKAFTMALAGSVVALGLLGAGVRAASARTTVSIGFGFSTAPVVVQRQVIVQQAVVVQQPVIVQQVIEAQSACATPVYTAPVYAAPACTTLVAVPTYGTPVYQYQTPVVVLPEVRRDADRDDRFNRDHGQRFDRDHREGVSLRIGDRR